MTYAASSAMLGITIAMAVPGTITYQTAVALVLGENIGTTITAILASIGTNSTAKRAARAHAIFNVFGAVTVSLIFWSFLDVVDGFIAGNPDAQAADLGTQPLDLVFAQVADLALALDTGRITNNERAGATDTKDVRQRHPGVLVHRDIDTCNTGH